MDQNNNQTNNNIKKATEKRKNPFDLEVQEDVVQSHVRPYSFEIEFGHQFNDWKKGLLAEAGESPLKPLINEVEGKRRLSNKKIEMADELLQQVSDAGKQFDSSFDEFFKNIEVTSDDMDAITASMDSFIESTTELQEVFENVKDFVEKP